MGDLLRQQERGPGIMEICLSPSFFSRHNVISTDSDMAGAFLRADGSGGRKTITGEREKNMYLYVLVLL